MFGLWIVLVFPTFASALDPVLLDEKALSGQLIGEKIEYFEDKKKIYTINHIIDQQKKIPFVQSKASSLNFGFTGSSYWVRFSVKNPKEKEIQWFLESDSPNHRFVALYYQDGERIVSKEINLHQQPAYEREVDSVNVLFQQWEKTGEKTYYMKFEADGELPIVLRAWSQKNLFENINRFTGFLYLFYGIMIIMFIYNLFIYFSLKESMYFYYIITIVSYVFMFLTIDGIGQNYIYAGSMLLINHAAPVMIAGAVMTTAQLARSYLDTTKKTPRLDKVLLGFIVVSGILGIASFGLPSLETFTLLIPVAMLLAFFILFILGPLYLKMGSHEAIFYYIANVLFFIGVLVNTGRTMGILPNIPVFRFSVQFGCVGTVLLFSLGLADKIHKMKDSLQDLNINLENKVNERTTELHTAMDMLDEFNKNLIQINKELEDAQARAALDMRMAANVQATLYPKSPIDILDWDISFVFRPLSGVSGDLYDFYVSDGVLKGAVLFDVSGHGVASGLLTLIVKSIFSRHFSLMNDARLNQVMQQANEDLIKELSGSEKYISGLLLRFTENTVEYVNAGHTDILMRRPQHPMVVPVKPATDEHRGFFLGLSEMRQSYKYISFKVREDDMILYFTDGLIESKNIAKEEYGLQRLSAAFAQAPNAGAQQILAYVMEDYNHFMEGCDLQDDLTIVLLKKRSAAKQ